MKKSFLLILTITITLSGLSQTWDEIIKAVPSDRAEEDFFGYSVSISGNKAIVGAYQEDEDVSGANTLNDAGAAYIFHFDGTNWIEEGKLVPSDRAADDYFGYSVGISGDKVIIGAYNEDEDASGANTITSSGSAYIFHFDGTNWVEEAKLVASDRAMNDFFGSSVSISNDKVIVGAYFKNYEAGGGSTLSSAGAAYVFSFDGTNWVEQAKLLPTEIADWDNFGCSVSISGDKVIVGSNLEDEDATEVNPLTNSGSAYIFSFDGTNWVQEAKLVSTDRAAYDFFGYSVSISENKAIIGAYQEDEDVSGANTLNGAGSAYIFSFDGANWVQEAKLVNSDRSVGDYFGHSVSISDNKVVVGANYESENASGTNTMSGAGSAYIFKFNGTNWQEEAKIVSSDRYTNDEFGYCVGISGDNIVIGVHNEDEDASGANTLENAGAVYFFKFNCPTSAPSGSANQNFCEIATVADLEAIGTGVNWYDNSTEGSLLNDTDNLLDGATYYATQTDNGCESQTRLAVSVTLNSQPISTVTVNGNILTADETSTTYQWIDCNNGNSPFGGAIQQSFAPGVSGSFAVKVTNGACMVTSECTTLSLLELGEIPNSQVSVYPNPFNDEFMVLTNQLNLDYHIMDITGKVIRQGELSSASTQIDLKLQAEGVYFLRVKNQIIKLIKN